MPSPRGRTVAVVIAVVGTALTSILALTPAHAGDVSAVRSTSSGLKASDVTTLDGILRDAWGGLPGGATAGLWVPGKGWWVGSVGEANIATGRLMSPDLQMPIGSVTKTLTGTLILQEVQKGTLSLDDTIAEWFPSFPKADAITIRMLLDMSSGIADFLNGNIAEVTAQQRAHPRRIWNPDEIIRGAAALPRTFDVPGSAFAYSNSNTVILGRILERVTGKSLTTLLDTRLLAPLGMDRSQLNQTGVLAPPFAQTYSSLYGEIHGGPDLVKTTSWSGSPYWAAGGLASTLADLRIWAKALGTGKGLLSPAMSSKRISDCIVQNAAATMTQKYCLGVAVVSDNATGDPIAIFHNGTVIGASSYVAYYPRTGAVLVVQSNQDSQTGDNAWTIPDKVSIEIAATLPQYLGIG